MLHSDTNILALSTMVQSSDLHPSATPKGVVLVAAAPCRSNIIIRERYSTGIIRKLAAMFGSVMRNFT